MPSHVSLPHCLMLAPMPESHDTKAFHLSLIHWAAAAPAFFTMSQFITNNAITAITATITAMTGRKARFTEPCATATIPATTL